MRAVVQRVSQSSVTVNDSVVGHIGRGLLVLLGVAKNDTEKDTRYLANKVASLRVFEDEDGKMNLSVKEIGGQILVVSQFTLLGDVRKGNRPSFVSAADPEKGDQFYQAFCSELRQLEIPVQTGQFRAQMDVQLNNDGPVTILLDSAKLF